MNFSLKGVIEAYDPYPEHQIMECILNMYNLPGSVLFNDKFIPMSDMMVMGYGGLKTVLYALQEANETFLESCLPELRALIPALRGDNNGW